MRHSTDSQFEAAVSCLRTARNLRPDSISTQKQISRAEAAITSRINEAGLTGEVVLVNNGNMEQSLAFGLTPHQGFILSRIDGKSNLQTIIKISPIPSVEALVVVWSLVKAGLIQLKS